MPSLSRSLRCPKAPTGRHLNVRARYFSQISAALFRHLDMELRDIRKNRMSQVKARDCNHYNEIKYVQDRRGSTQDARSPAVPYWAIPQPHLPTIVGKTRACLKSSLSPNPKKLPKRKSRAFG